MHKNAIWVFLHDFIYRTAEYKNARREDRVILPLPVLPISLFFSRPSTAKTRYRETRTVSVFMPGAPENPG